MTRTQSSAIALVFAALLAGPTMANAATTTLSRAQVQTELADAVRTGNVLADENGSKLNDIFPHNYASTTGNTLTRAQVQAELAAAQQSGTITNGESAQRMNELFPHNYPAVSQSQGKTRAEVQAETDQARAQGLLNRYVGA